MPRAMALTRSRALQPTLKWRSGNGSLIKVCLVPSTVVVYQSRNTSYAKGRTLEPMYP